MKFNFSHNISQKIIVSLIMLLTFLGHNVMAGTQSNPGWALDRIDGTLDATYTYNKTGRESVIYIFDSGLDLKNTDVRKEFTDSITGELRASIFYDFNYPLDQMGGNPSNDEYGKPCSNHGTKVSAIVAGNTYGVAKDATIRMVKIANNTTCGFQTVWLTTALEWLNQNFDNGEIIKAGDIINLSMGLYEMTNCRNSNSTLSNWEAIEDAIEGLRSKGVIIIKSAGNNGCDPSNLPIYRTNATFLVGGTWKRRLKGNTADNGPLSKDVTGSFYGHITQEGLDEVVYKVRSFDLPIRLSGLELNVGDAIDAYAPAHRVNTMDSNGQPTTATGTSFSAPIIAGIFAVACEANPSVCRDPSADFYTLIKTASGQKGNIVTKNDKILNGAYSDRAVFLEQLW